MAKRNSCVGANIKNDALSLHIGRAPCNSNLKLRIIKRLKVYALA